MIAVLIIGPTVLILNMFTSSTGSLFNTFLFNSLDTAALNSQKGMDVYLDIVLLGLVVKLEPIRWCIYCPCI